MPRAEHLKEPHSIEAEKSVLGAILLDPTAVESLKGILDPDDFYHSAHKIIFSAALDVHESGSVVDTITLSTRINELEKSGVTGGITYLGELLDSCPSAANIEHYAKIIKDKATRRRVVSNAREIAIKATDPNQRLEEIPTRLSIEIPRGPETSDAASIIKQLQKNIAAGYPGLPTGYNILERTIRKVMPGHLWICGAYTSIGKTAFLVDFIRRQFKNFTPPAVAIFSTEMSCEQYILRLISNMTKVPSWAITEKMIKPEQEAEVVRAQISLSKMPLHIYDKFYRIEDIERQARKLKEESGLEIMAIDYLQNIWGEGTIYDRMSRLAPVLQYLAKELEITIIALSQVNNEHAKDSKTDLFGYKGAGEIAASADVGIELERDRVVKEKLVFRVKKNRHGRTGEGCLEYVAGYTRFREIVEEGENYS